MNRQMFQWISQLVRDKPDQITSRPISNLGQQVRLHYGCGHIRNNRLVFSAEDKRCLRQLVMEELGLDPFMTEQLPTDRLDMAKFHSNEKLAAGPVGEDHLLLNSADGIIRVNNEQIRLYSDSIKTTGLLCLNSSIDTVEHQTIVVVENLAIMPLCHTWQLPLPDQHALWVYRGDYKSGAKAQTCRDFVRRFGADKTVIIFSDMDPKGLEIAVTLPFAKFWLGPHADYWRPLLDSKYASRVGFDTQSDATGYLLHLMDSNLLSEPFKTLISVMRDKRSSFRQEHSYSHNVPLELFAIRAKGHALS